MSTIVLIYASIPVILIILIWLYRRFTRKIVLISNLGPDELDLDQILGWRVKIGSRWNIQNIDLDVPALRQLIENMANHTFPIKNIILALKLPNNAVEQRLELNLEELARANLNNAKLIAWYMIPQGFEPRAIQIFNNEIWSKYRPRNDHQIEIDDTESLINSINRHLSIH
jgi:hypothetical protein